MVFWKYVILLSFGFSLCRMALSLTEEQEKVVSTAVNGHNFLLTGKAGTGKSFVIKTIVRKLESLGRKVAIVCASGIACTVYDEGCASTVHSHYALYTADMPANLVVQRACSLDHVAHRIKDADAIIWDECGMSSRRLLELVNRVHHLVAENDDKMKAFGGKQVILSGDFLQLRPVPNLFDGGSFMFYSDLFIAAIPHRFTLTRAMRQDNGNAVFVDALQELRMGHCSENTERYLKSLSRPIHGDPIHIYFRKLAVELHNLSIIHDMPGQQLTLNCQDEGDTEGISCPAPRKLILKPGAKVMLVWNLTKSLKNGSCGTFLRKANNQLEVAFGGMILKIDKVTWFKNNNKGEVIGKRTQFPLSLCYASTCHKVQGLTLDAVVVHCSKEFVAGLIYVAASRVRQEGQLQLLNFNRKQLILPSLEAINVCQINEPLNIDCTCCNQKALDESLFNVSDKEQCSYAVDEDTDHDDVDTTPESVQSFFEHDNDVIADIAEIYGTIADNEEQLGSLPDDIDIANILKEKLIELPQSEFSRNLNTLIRETLMCEGVMQKLALFAKIIWYQIFLLFRQHIVHSNIDDEFSMKRKDFAEATNSVYLLICSQDFYHQLRAVFDINAGSVLQPSQRTVGSHLTNTLYRLFIHKLVELFLLQRQTECVTLSLSEMPAEGLAKIRHVGGWAIRKELERCRRYVKNNMFSSSPTTISHVNNCHGQCQLLEDFVILQYEELNDTSFPDTLEVTEVRQYRERGLLHISDSTYVFFRRLEELRINIMNISKLQANAAVNENFLQKAMDEAINDDELAILWDDIFLDVTDKNKQDLIVKLKNGVITRYMRMAGCQFLKDFRRAYSLSKSSEHRKKVLQKQHVAAVKKDHVPFDEIVKDRSEGKRASHTRLFAFVHL